MRGWTRRRSTAQSAAGAKRAAPGGQSVRRSRRPAPASGRAAARRGHAPPRAPAVSRSREGSVGCRKAASTSAAPAGSPVGGHHRRLERQRGDGTAVIVHRLERQFADAGGAQHAGRDAKAVSLLQAAACECVYEPCSQSGEADCRLRSAACHAGVAHGLRLLSSKARSRSSDLTLQTKARTR